MSLTTEQVALIAAILAFSASITNIFINLFEKRSSDFSAAHRRLLEPYVHKLSEALHQISASSAMLIKNNNNDVVAVSWREKASRAQADIQTARRALRYPLWGLDAGLRNVSRLSDWVDHVRTSPEAATRILDAGGDLRKALDEAIRNSYLKGRPPRLWDIILVKRRSESLKRIRDEVMEIPKANRT